MPIHPHFFHNQWHASTGQAFTSHNPATNALVWSGYAATEKEVSSAVAAAQSAAAEWGTLPLDARIAYLERFRKILTREAAALAEAISKEVGKPLWESKTEVAAMIQKIPISIEAYHARCPEVVKTQQNGRSITRHKPHGVIAIFGPFNFPGHLPNGHIIPALLAGNTLVFKPSELTPGVAELTMKLWEECQLPPGVLNMIQGGRETGRLLAASRNINGLLFTGSWTTGKMLSELFGKTPEKILALELGGNNPLVVHDVADIATAALITVQSAFITAGQRCTCAKRLIIPQGKQGDAFIEELKRLMATIRVGPYTEQPEPFMGPVITGAAAQRLLTIQTALREQGAHSLIEMHLLQRDTALLSPGLIDVTPILHRPDEEIFGPLLQVIRVPNFEAAIAEANQTAYGLAAGLLCDSEALYTQFYQQVRAGVISWNMPLTGASSAAPFGGVGHSGNNRPSAFYAADYCAYPVASMESHEIKPPATRPPGVG
jgi:succinylglutamic semialdehyde dehydrogenase